MGIAGLTIIKENLHTILWTCKTVIKNLRHCEFLFFYFEGICVCDEKVHSVYPEEYDIRQVFEMLHNPISHLEKLLQSTPCATLKMVHCRCQIPLASIVIYATSVSAGFPQSSLVTDRDCQNFNFYICCLKQSTPKAIFHFQCK